MASALLTGSCSAANKDVPGDTIDCEPKKHVLVKFVSKGGFADCYELRDKDTNTTYAGKVVFKACVVEPTNKAKMADEIQMHRALNQAHIVGLHSSLEDEKKVNITLQLCSRWPLKEMQQRRETLSEAEARYYIRQLLLGFQYLAEQRNVHRDPKMANLLLNEATQLEVTGLGLAARIGIEGERKKTLCRAPNYVAPGILSKKGHGFEVDVSSLGCILSTMLETPSAQGTYVHIQKKRDEVLVSVSSEALALFRRMLQPEPENRPGIHAILKAASTKEARVSAGAQMLIPGQQGKLKLLQRLLHQLFSVRPPMRHFEVPEEVEDPASMPVYWISKWVDYSCKYGMVYQLCDGSIGALFNDNTCVTLPNNNESMIYVDERGTKHYHTLDEYPLPLAKKARLLDYFKDYMKEYLVATGQGVRLREHDDIARLPYLGTWLRTLPAVFFYLTNGTVQVNFCKDHTKLVLCPLMAAVTYIDATGAFHTYRLKTLQRGCPRNLLSRLQYIRTILAKWPLGHAGKPRS